MDVLKPCALSSHEPAARCRARGSTTPRLQSCCQVSGVKQVSGPGSEGCWWTGAACRQAGTGRGPVGWQCQSSPQERHVVSEPVSEPVSPWCLLLVSRTRHSRESMGLRGEQGTLFCPWQACSGVPSGFSMGHGDTHHPKASLPAGGIGLSPEEWAQIVLVTPWDLATCHNLLPLFLDLTLGGNP